MAFEEEGRWKAALASACEKPEARSANRPSSRCISRKGSSEDDMTQAYAAAVSSEMQVFSCTANAWVNVDEFELTSPDTLRVVYRYGDLLLRKSLDLTSEHILFGTSECDPQMFSWKDKCTGCGVEFNKSLINGVQMFPNWCEECKLCERLLEKSKKHRNEKSKNKHGDNGAGDIAAIFGAAGSLAGAFG